MSKSVTNNKEAKMKTTKIKIEAIQFENGHILLGKCSFSGNCMVKTSDGITEYTESEMVEVYNYKGG